MGVTMKNFQLIPMQIAFLFSYVEACLDQPVMSRGQQQLPINCNECLSRAHKALRTVGFTNGGSGNFAQGFKDASGTYIHVQRRPGRRDDCQHCSRIGNDDGVPGLLRQCLQVQMERPGASTACNGGGGGSISGICDISATGCTAIMGRNGHSHRPIGNGRYRAQETGFGNSSGTATLSGNRTPT
jgi:hypothetical protein